VYKAQFFLPPLLKKNNKKKKTNLFSENRSISSPIDQSVQMNVKLFGFNVKINAKGITI